MENTADNIATLREKIGETIPQDGTEADTMFTDTQLGRWLLNSPSMTHAIVEGWENKLNEWAGLVDVTDGASARKLGQLMEHGESRVRYYRGLLPGGAGTRAGRARVGKIIRSE